MMVTAVGRNMFSLNLRDMDNAGADWVEMIATALRGKERRYTVLFPPNGLDPDEAFLSGWWPPIIS